MNKEQLVHSMEARIELGIAIHDGRIAWGLSQQDLAKKAHTTQKVISRVESADVSVGFDLLTRILTALNFRLEIVASPTTKDST